MRVFGGVGVSAGVHLAPRSGAKGDFLGFWNKQVLPVFMILLHKRAGDDQDPSFPAFLLLIRGHSVPAVRGQPQLTCLLAYGRRGSPPLY